MSYNNHHGARMPQQELRFDPGPEYAAFQARQDMRPPKLGGYSKKDLLGSIAESWGPVQEREFGMFASRPDPKSRSNSPFRVLIDPATEITMAREEALRQARQGTEYEQFGGGRAPWGYTTMSRGNSTPRTERDEGSRYHELSRSFSAADWNPPFPPHNEKSLVGLSFIRNHRAPAVVLGQFTDGLQRNVTLNDWDTSATVIDDRHWHEFSMGSRRGDEAHISATRAHMSGDRETHNVRSTELLRLTDCKVHWDNVQRQVDWATASISTWTDDPELIKARFDEIKVERKAP